jgi:UDP-N-acetylmuramoyl-tripeptide--D-alanyl-D-alanine ligase
MKSGLSIRSQMFGHYNASNMLAAYAVGHHFKIDQKRIADRLSHFIPGANRSEMILYRGCTIIKDAYNANPSSMKLAVRAFSALFPQGWVILGDMKELGEATSQSHQDMIESILSTQFERIYLVGVSFSKAYQAMAAIDSRIIVKENIDGIKEKWNWEDCKDKALLLKGSRSMHLESLLDD